ncbi:MAG TPA: cysteine--tRNA ligase [Candidatus Polarisedimenticolia bacterium]|nr:cysteine--tRNA ligase [Candidatus Polarisedimenticolia bacterium]
MSGPGGDPKDGHRPWGGGLERGIRFHDTMTRRLEPLEPLVPGEVRLYTCGPTVYDFAHIGNFRCYVWEDTLRRFLRHRGLRVVQVMNLTDVDDKTIRNAAAAGVALDEYTRAYIDAFFEDLDTLGFERAEIYPRATRHVAEMVALCRGLIARGHTYESQGSIYFRIASFPSYGRLSRLDPEGMRPGARGESDEYEKDDVRDFVLWKARKEGEPFWESELGPGRPGWHLECSAMSMKYLGESFDIHTGAVDNIFPHHENEIAQSEAATGRPFVRRWMHCEHLIVDGEKMSKSKGNFYTLRDLLAKGLAPRAIRYFLLTAHYRKQLNFTLEGVAQAAAALERLEAFEDRLGREPAGRPGELLRAVERAAARAEAALEDDLNVPGALGAAFDLVRDANSAFDRGEGSAAEREALAGFLQELRYLLGTPAGRDSLSQDVDALIRRREEARGARDFAAADRIRDELAARGIVLEDTPQGVRWRRKG